MKFKNLTILLMILSLTVLFVSGCDDRDFPTKTGAQYRIERLEASVDKIYADNNVTFSYISAYVKDRNNFGAANYPVNFQADRGSIISLANTNNSGVARVPFYDAGQVGVATITAFVYTQSEIIEGQTTAEHSKQVIVTIEDKPAIGDINIEISSKEFFVNQSVVVRARLYDVNSDPVADSTMVRFETNRGHFVASDGDTNLGSIAIIPTQNGNAPLRLNVGQQAGQGIVTVKIDTLVAGETFNVKAGNPFNLELRTYLADDDLNPVEETNEAPVDNVKKIVIEASLKDAYNNPNSNRVVRFETSIGSFYNTADSYSQNTDNQGISKVVFTPGLSAGAAIIKAFANSDTLSSEVLFTIKSDQLYSIRFSNQDNVHLNVANTGGVDSKILYVDLYDINGNLVDRPTDIYFKLVNSNIPGASEGHPAYLSGQDANGVVHTTSSGGHAAVSVVTGVGSGVLKLRASNNINALDNPSTPGAIVASKTNILIHSGPPAVIDWGEPALNQGTGVGAGLWELLIGSNVRDRHNNPVDYGTSVWFNIDGNTEAMIQGNGYVGNGPEVTSNDASASEIDSLSSVGIAYTLLTYPSKLTLSTVPIRATCIGINGDEISAVTDFILPWNEPDTDMQVTPGHIDFWDVPSDNPLDFWWDPATPDAVDYVKAITRSRDGQGHPISGVEWTFTSDRGQFVEQDPTWPVGYVITPTAHKVTSDVDGYATARILIVRGDGLPSPDGVSPGQQQILVIGKVLGTGINEREGATILRFPFACPY